MVAKGKADRAPSGKGITDDTFNLGNSSNSRNSCQGLWICCPRALRSIRSQQIRIPHTLEFCAFFSNLGFYLIFFFNFFFYFFWTFFRCGRRPISALVKSFSAHSGTLKCGRLVVCSENLDMSNPQWVQIPPLLLETLSARAWNRKSLFMTTESCAKVISA